MSITKTFSVTPKMREFAEAQKGRNVRPMSYLYEDASLDAISEMGAKFVFASIMRDHKNVDPDDEFLHVKAKDPYKLIPAFNTYASFVCEFNPNFKPEDFDRVFDAMWEFYFDYLQSRFYDASDWGEHWLDGWEEYFLD